MLSSRLTKRFSHLHLKAGHYLWLALFVFMLFLPGRASLPPLDRDEARYMQSTSQMVESGNYIDVRFQRKPRYLQPAGIYWLEAIAVKATGTLEQKAVWAYRIPSLLAAIGAVLLTVWIGNLFFDSTVGLLSGILLAISVLLTAEGRMATIDTTLLFFVILTECSLARAWLARAQVEKLPLTVALCYWGAIGCGLMLKGPLILIPAFGTPIALAVIERDKSWWTHLRPTWGWIISLIIVLPWFIAIGVVSYGAFFTDSVGTNFLGKVASGQQAHGLPPGYYLLVFLIAFWPGSLFTAWSLPFIWKERRSDRSKFLLCWIIPHWLIFEAIATKLPHYVLPVYPAIAILTVAALVNISEKWNGPVSLWGKILLGIYAFFWCGVGLGLTFGGVWLEQYFRGIFSWSTIVIAISAFALIIVTLFCFCRQEIQQAALASIAAALMIYVELFAIVIPSLKSQWLSYKIAQLVQDVRPCPNSILASSSYSEPSLVFLVGKETQLINPKQTVQFLQKNRSCGIALVDIKDQPLFFSYLEKDRLQVKLLGRVLGLNYSNGKHLDLNLFQLDSSN